MDHCIEVLHLVDLVTTQCFLVKGFSVLFIVFLKPLLLLGLSLSLEELLRRTIQGVLLHLFNTVKTREDLDLLHDHVASFA
jgi:hypothetical protein